MKKYKEFPYPKPDKITVYGRKGCPYCEKIKNLLKIIYADNYKKKIDYIDIFELIEKKQVKDITDFKKKMNPITGDWNTVPMIFDGINFIGGYDDYMRLTKRKFRKLLIEKNMGFNFVKNEYDNFKNIKEMYNFIKNVKNEVSKKKLSKKIDEKLKKK